MTIKIENIVQKMKNQGILLLKILCSSMISIGEKRWGMWVRTWKLEGKVKDFIFLFFLFGGNERI